MNTRGAIVPAPKAKKLTRYFTRCDGVIPESLFAIAFRRCAIASLWLGWSERASLRNSDPACSANVGIVRHQLLKPRHDERQALVYR